MKKMTCRQLGGACDQEFHANTFEEMAELSRNHGKEMFKKADQPHLDAMHAMAAMKNTPEEMKNWFESKRQEFDSLPEIS